MREKLFGAGRDCRPANWRSFRNLAVAREPAPALEQA